MVSFKREGGSIPLSGDCSSIPFSCHRFMGNSTIKFKHEWEQNLARDIESSDWQAEHVFLGVLVMGANTLIEGHRVLTGLTLDKAVAKNRLIKQTPKPYLL